MNIGEVYFTLRGLSLDPDAITTELGIQPSHVKRKTDPTPKLSSWSISSGRIVSEMVDVYALGEAVVAQLQGCEEAIRRLCAEHQFDATLQVVLITSPDDRLSTPAIGFSRQTVQFLGSVGASIDVDTYRGSS